MSQSYPLGKKPAIKGGRKKGKWGRVGKSSPREGTSLQKGVSKGRMEGVVRNRTRREALSPKDRRKTQTQKKTSL